MEEDRFEVIDQDAYEAVNAKERTRITSFDDASFYYVDGSLTEAVIAGKKRQTRKLAQKQPVRRSPALEWCNCTFHKGTDRIYDKNNTGSNRSGKNVSNL